MTSVVIASAARTPVGSFNGAFASVPAHELGATAIRGALERAGVDPKEVDEVIMGQILTAGEGQNPARQASMAAGCPQETTAWNLNQLCGSGLRTVAIGMQQIETGDADLIVAASTATATRLAQGAYPGNTREQVRWLGSIGADYGVIAVSADSDVETLPQLLDQIKADPTSVSVAGGSAVGGWDHLKVLIAANAYGIEDVRPIKYIAFDGGGEAVTQLLAGSVQAFTGDLSEAKGFVDSGDIKVIAVLSPERLDGEFADMPTAKEQGIDAIGANWRGFYAPGGMSDAAYDAWVSKIAELYASDEWKEVMAANGLAPLDLQGAEFEQFVSESVSKIQDISREIGIIK